MFTVMEEGELVEKPEYVEVSGAKECSRVLNECYSKLGEQNAGDLKMKLVGPATKWWTDFIEKNPMEFLPTEDLSVEITHDEFMQALLDVKTKSAAGLDDIGFKFYVEPDVKEVQEFLFKFIRMSFRLKYFPSAWRNILINPIYKAGKPPKMSNSWRLISLLSSASKIMKRIIATRLEKVFSELNLFPSTTFGYRKNTSALDFILLLIERVMGKFAQGLVCGMIFLDLSSAFNTICRDVLLSKFRDLHDKFPGKIGKSFI